MSRLLASLLLALLLFPTRLHAQTEEIQVEVERALWWARFYQTIESVTGMPPAVALCTFLILLLAILAAVWLWLSRRKRPD